MGRAWVPDTKEVQDTAGKVMATVFWNAKCVIMLDFYTREVQNWSGLCKLV